MATALICSRAACRGVEVQQMLQEEVVEGTRAGTGAALGMGGSMVAAPIHPWQLWSCCSSVPGDMWLGPSLRCPSP